ncbi:MAG: hypothetical protein J0H88_08315 [Sphingomonadales bacterium]|nr:hypothetical protein [Sphingomonadales bacterium]
MFGLGFGVGFGRMGAAAAYGLPPFVFPSDKMLLGMGLGGIANYTGDYPFANPLWNADRWSQQSGTGTYTQEWGVLNAQTPTDIFACKFADGASAINNLPSGTYTVLNPDGLEIGIGWGGSPNLTGFVPPGTPEFTFNRPSAGAGAIALWAKGSVTNNNGPIQIIMPGRKAAFQAGDYFNPAFISALSALNVKSLRFMDWLLTYGDLSVDWSEVAPGLPITFVAPQTQLQAKVPYRLVVDLCNRLNIAPWINGPVRANASYQSALAAYLKTNLNPGLYVFPEFGNEVWNPGAAYNDARAWVETYNHTRIRADSNLGINGWTLTAHGLSNDDPVSVFQDKGNFTYRRGQSGDGGGAADWPLGGGATLYIEVVDANNFRLRVGSSSGTIVAPTAQTPKITISKRTEAGKTLSVAANHGQQSLAMWNRFDAILGRNRCHHVLGVQLVDTGGTTTRLAQPGVAAATDSISVAVYYSGDWWVSCLDITSGQVVPKGWANRGGSAIRIAVYALGSTPTMAEVLAGTGTGYVGHRDISIASSNMNAHTSAAAITGLTNGTSYEHYAVATLEYGYKFMARGQFTASATPSTVWISDSDDNMAARARRSSLKWLEFADAQRAAVGSIAIEAYECGSDFQGASAATPAEVQAWRAAWSQTSVAADAFAYVYKGMAAHNFIIANQFVLMNGTPGNFNMMESYDDTADLRYQYYSGAAGSVAKATPLTMGNVTAADIKVAPSYPATFHTFANAALTYRIHTGDVNGNFAISGNQLRIVNGYGIDWVVPTIRSLVVEASDGNTSIFFTVQFSTGFAWYPADAQLAFDSIVDSDGAAMNPLIGNTLNLTGTAPAISGGMWDFEATGRYNFATTLTATIPGTVPILIAAILDKDNHTAAAGILQAFASSYCSFYYNSGVLYARWVASGTNDVPFAATMPTGKHVFWTYYDADPTTPKIHAGVDQTENVAAAVAKNLSGFTFSRNMYVGGDGSLTATSKMQHGSLLVHGKAGLTQADALTLVGNMQTLQGIP